MFINAESAWAPSGGAPRRVLRTDCERAIPGANEIASAAVQSLSLMLRVIRAPLERNTNSNLNLIRHGTVRRPLECRSLPAREPNLGEELGAGLVDVAEAEADDGSDLVSLIRL
jgi:hypothetical protein